MTTENMSQLHALDCANLAASYVSDEFGYAMEELRKVGTLRKDFAEVRKHFDRLINYAYTVQVFLNAAEAASLWDDTSVVHEVFDRIAAGEL